MKADLVPPSLVMSWLLEPLSLSNHRLDVLHCRQQATSEIYAATAVEPAMLFLNRRIDSLNGEDVHRRNGLLALGEEGGLIPWMACCCSRICLCCADGISVTACAFLLLLMWWWLLVLMW